MPAARGGGVGLKRRARARAVMERLAVVVPRERAEGALRALLAAGLLDGSRKVARGPDVTIPVLEGDGLRALVEPFGGRLVENAPLEAREERVTPHAQALALLDALPEEARALVPDGWEKLGDVVVLRLPDALMPHAREVASAFAKALGATCVVRDASGVSGELREMRGELLLGNDPVGTHLENGVRYRLDASRIMFSSGNVAERKRAASIPASGETVVDMFAGIGYFTLPLAVHAKPARIVAIEKNPLSFRFLQENVALNDVGAIVEPWLGDNREYPAHGFADRVLMGYFPGTRAFLPTALSFLKPEGGVIHYHDTAGERGWKEEMTRAFLDAARACGRVVAIQEARVVKSHSPGVVHAVVVARVSGGQSAAR